MKKTLTIFLSMGLIVLFSANIEFAKEKKTIWTVPGDFATIQMAIDDANVFDGHTILVGIGEFSGAVMSKAIEIKGIGKGKTVIIDGPLLTSYMPCGTIILDIGFFFDGSGAGTGSTISHMSFEGIAFPIFSRGADDVSVSHCYMFNPIQGVTNWNGSRWLVDHNEIEDLRSANGGGIGIFVGGNIGGIVEDNVVSHNKISGTLYVAPCDGGGYQGTGIVLYADWRYGRSGAAAIVDNRFVKNNIGLTSDDPSVVDVVACELSEAENPSNIVICGNAIGFNDFRKTVIQIA